jgi:hypothetical protein
MKGGKNEEEKGNERGERKRESKQEKSSVIAILRSVTGAELLYTRKANIRRAIQG